MTEEFRCLECGGNAAAKGEVCFNCDGTGKPKFIIAAVEKAAQKQKKELAKKTKKKR